MGENISKRLPPARTDVYDWQLRGACRGRDLRTFFHPDGERGAARARRRAAAKAICQTCPVIDACLKHALAVREPYGVWGGMSEEERGRLLASGTGATAQTSYEATVTSIKQESVSEAAVAGSPAEPQAELWVASGPSDLEAG